MCLYQNMWQLSRRLFGVNLYLLTYKNEVNKVKFETILPVLVVVNIGTNTSLPLGYKTFFMLNSTEHEISTAHKNKIQTNEEVSCFKSPRSCIYHANKC